MAEEKKGQYSVERLVHFICPSCKKWWSISDPPKGRSGWSCPWCGLVTVYTEKREEK